MNTPVFTAAIGPGMRQRDGPPRVNGREALPQELAVKHLSKETKRTGVIAQAVTMSQEELFVVNGGDKRFEVENHATLFSEVIGEPHIVVSDKEMHLNARVGQLAQLTKQTGESFGHHVLVLVPVVEYIT